MDTISDLILCGTYARNWEHRRLFYALKTKILEVYATFDGYDLQIWYDDSWNWDEQYYAEHRHILKRYSYNGHIFHSPTNEFEYFNFAHQNGKASPGFSELLKQCTRQIEGRKPFLFPSKETEELCWQALKRLVRTHGHLLRNRQQLSFEFYGHLES